MLKLKVLKFNFLAYTGTSYTEKHLIRNTVSFICKVIALFQIFFGVL